MINYNNKIEMRIRYLNVLMDNESAIVVHKYTQIIVVQNSCATVAHIHV